METDSKKASYLGVDMMTIHGHSENGTIVPNAPLSLPNGTEVEIVVPLNASGGKDLMTPEQKKRQQQALAELDAIEDENPGDTFSGADHDKVLYSGEAHGLR